MASVSPSSGTILDKRNNQDGYLEPGGSREAHSNVGGLFQDRKCCGIVGIQIAPPSTNNPELQAMKRWLGKTLGYHLRIWVIDCSLHQDCKTPKSE